jgi:hypothetical protein
MKKLTRKERAEMPNQFGLAGIIARSQKQKPHKNKKKYTRKVKHK